MFYFFRAGCSINVKDFKASWRSGVVFLAILYALRPELVDLSKARTRSNKQNLEEAFCIAEKELKIPKLLDPDGESIYRIYSQVKYLILFPNTPENGFAICFTYDFISCLAKEYFFES